MSLDILNPVILKKHKPKGGFCVVSNDMIDDTNYSYVNYDFGVQYSDIQYHNWTQLSNPPTRRSHFAMEYWEDACWILGGVVDGSPSNTLERYDIQTDSYQTISIASADGNTFPGTAAFASGIHNGIFYVAGGTNGSGATRNTWAIDLTTWQDDPTPTVYSTKKERMPDNWMLQGCIGPDGNLYTEGGNDGGIPEQISRAVNYYDTANNNWVSVSNQYDTGDTLPKIHDQTLILLNGLIYSSGGRNEVADVYFDQHKYYDISNDEWVELEPLPFRVNDQCGVAWNGKIVLFGGASDETGQNLIDAHRGVVVYDPALNEWRLIDYTPVGFSLGEATEWRGDAYIISLNHPTLPSTPSMWKFSLDSQYTMAIRMARGL